MHHQITIYFESISQNSRNGKTFNDDDEAVKSHLVQFFADKDQKFYERGIMKLPETRGRQSLIGEPRSSRPPTVVTNKNISAMKNLIKE